VREIDFGMLLFRWEDNFLRYAQ